MKINWLYCVAIGLLLQACTKNQHNSNVQDVTTVDGEKKIPVSILQVQGINKKMV
jgi:hypothetical protein